MNFLTEPVEAKPEVEEDNSEVEEKPGKAPVGRVAKPDFVPPRNVNREELTRKIRGARDN